MGAKRYYARPVQKVPTVRSVTRSLLRTSFQTDRIWTQPPLQDLLRPDVQFEALMVQDKLQKRKGETWTG